MADSNTGGEQIPSGEQPQGAGGGQQQAHQQSPQGGGQQQQPVAGAQQEKTYSFKEDRSDWVPRTRLNEVSGKLTKLETETLTLKQQLELAEKRTRALAGLDPADPKSKETEEVRAAILQLFPGLGHLGNLSQEELTEVLEAAREARSSSQATWQRHATGMLTDLYSEAARELDVEKLTETQQKQLKRAYREEATSAVQEREAAMRRGERQTLETLPTDNDFVARHERGDKTLLKEFAKAFIADWYEPARRSVTARLERQGRAVPKGDRVRSVVTQGAQQLDLNNNTDFKKALIAARGASE